MRMSVLRALALASVLAAGSAAVAQDAPPAPAQPEVAAPAEPPPAPPSPETPPSDAPPSAPAPSASAVQVQSLDQLDLFSTGRDTGLGQDVWKGASAEIARAVIPSLAAAPLSPAAAALARRLLAQAATAPTGAGSDQDLALARARALVALGDADDASLVFDRTPGVSDNPDLSREAAEVALISEQDDKACRIAGNLSTGREGAWWLRLRAFCQARAGKPDEAQLTFNLAGPPGKDAQGRLLAVFIAGAGDPGPASLRGGLDFAVSRALKLDLAAALPTASPAISRRWLLKNPPPETPASDAAAGSAQALIQDAATAAANEHPDPAVLDRLVDLAGHEASPRIRARLQAAAALLASLGGTPTGAARAALAGFDLGRSEAPARLLALDTAAGAGLKGETALLALLISAASGPAPADRCWIIRALMRIGLAADARAFAVEGLTQLRGGA